MRYLARHRKVEGFASLLLGALATLLGLVFLVGLDDYTGVGRCRLLCELVLLLGAPLGERGPSMALGLFLLAFGLVAGRRGYRLLQPPRLG